MEDRMKQEIDFGKIKEQQKAFFKKTQMLMYVLMMLALAMAVFFYVVTIGNKIFIIAVLLLMALMGALVAVDARKKQFELDDFALYYGINKIKNGTKEEEKI